MNVSSLLGLRKLAKLLYGNQLERLKKHESCVHNGFKVVFHAQVNSSDLLVQDTKRVAKSEVGTYRVREDRARPYDFQEYTRHSRNYNTLINR